MKKDEAEGRDACTHLMRWELEPEQELRPTGQGRHRSRRLSRRAAARPRGSRKAVWAAELSRSP